jgi:hypothetical protein
MENNHDPGSEINIPDPQHCLEPSKTKKQNSVGLLYNIFPLYASSGGIVFEMKLQGKSIRAPLLQKPDLFTGARIYTLYIVL